MPSEHSALGSLDIIEYKGERWMISHWNSHSNSPFQIIYLISWADKSMRDAYNATPISLAKYERKAFSSKWIDDKATLIAGFMDFYRPTQPGGDGHD